MLLLSHPPSDLVLYTPLGACAAPPPGSNFLHDAATDAEMQSRVTQEYHQRRQTAARITGADAERTAFLTGLIEDDLLVQDARASFLAHLRRDGITPGSPLFDLAAEEALPTVLRAAFRRLDDLLHWEADRAPLAGWWGLQALYEYNNDGRRQAERRAGFQRSTGQTVVILSDHQPDAAGTLQALPLPDTDADPAERYERQHAAEELDALFQQAEGDPALAWLREWLSADALHAEKPVTFHGGAAQLAWRYGAQQAMATRQNVTTRTLRNHAREVERLLCRLAGLAQVA